MNPINFEEKKTSSYQYIQSINNTSFHQQSKILTP
jgi:hypothetical protein